MPPDAAPAPEARLIRIRASAGSGKTHSLTARFLRLLAEAEPHERPFFCAQAQAKGHGWPEIMAVTFTNKAAMEMKERIVRELKRRALGDFSGAAGPEWSEQRAKAILERILRRYQSLGVRTIDSLVCLLTRLFALRLGLSPDFSVTFDMAELFDPALEDYLARCEAAAAAGDEGAAALFVLAADTLLAHVRRTGFNLRQHLKDQIRDMAALFRFQPPRVEFDQAVLADLLRPSHAAFQRSARRLLDCLARDDIKVHAAFQTALGKCLDLPLFVKPKVFPASAYFDKEGLSGCVAKASLPRVSLAHEESYLRFQEALEAHREANAVLSGAYSLAPSVALATLLASDLAESAARQECLPLPTLYDLASSLLKNEGAVGGAWCRLGARLHHLCVDEFQDTSEEQWGAVEPLALEALAKGGSLYCVGDAKQAIYGWRGGKAELFETLATGGLSRLAAHHDDGLAHNWRSREAVVGFNNDFFSALGAPGLAGELADAVFAKAPADVREDFGLAVARTFADSRQQLPPDRDTAGGYVRLARLALPSAGSAEEAGALGTAGAAGEEEEAGLREAVCAVVQEVAARRGAGAAAVLVRTNDQAAQVSDWLMACGLAVVTEGSLHLGRHPAVRLLLELLTFLDHPPDDAAFAAVLGAPGFQAESGIATSDINAFLATRGKGPLYIRFREAFPAAWKRLVEPFFRSAGLVRPYDTAFELAAAFRLALRNPGDELFIRRFLEIVHLAEEAGAGSLSAFLEFWADKGVEEKVPLPGNVDAVRVMTMHKAKGLQFPVVVVPFHGWTLNAPDQDYDFIEIGQTRVIAPIRARDVGAPHWRVMTRMAREHLNLLYVAWTRAEEELYGFLPAKNPRGASPVLAATAMVLGDIPPGGAVERGTRPAPGPDFAPPPAPQPCPLPPRETPPDIMAWLPRLRVHRHAVQESVDHMAALRGEVAHRAMELLRPVAANERPHAAQAAALCALADFPEAAELGPGLASDIAAMAAWALSLPELAQALAHGRREAAMLDAQGRTHRADLLLLEDDAALVVEYKTGEEAPEHAVQTRRYLGLLAAMPDRRRALRGLLVYLDARRLVPVLLPADKEAAR